MEDRQTYKLTDRQTYRLTDRQTNRHTDGWRTDRPTDRLMFLRWVAELRAIHTSCFIRNNEVYFSRFFKKVKKSEISKSEPFSFFNADKKLKTKQWRY
jgi:hypothetical protein